MLEVREVDTLDVPWLRHIKDRISVDGQVYKQCTYRSGHWAKIEDFSRNNSKTDKLHSYCKDCHKHCTKNSNIRRKLKPSLIEKQNYKCGMCGEDLRGFTTANFVTVDHDHKTDMTRMVLCVNCNSGLSKFGDNPFRMFYGGFYVIYFKLKYYTLKMINK